MLCAETVLLKMKKVYIMVGGKQAFLIRPGEKCKYIASSDNPWSYIWIGFTGTLAVKFDGMSLTCFRSDKVPFIKGENMNAGSEAFLTGMLFKLYADLFLFRYGA